MWTMQRPRTCVVGAGGIGGTIAAYLARAGRDVVVVDPWVEHVEAIRSHGLRVQAPDGGVQVAMEAVLPEEVTTTDRTCDLVVIAVKAHATPAALEWVRPWLAPDVTIVCAQNGITEDGLSSRVASGSVLGCVVMLGAEFFEPGVVRRTTPAESGSLVLGSLDGNGTSRAVAAARVLRAVGKVEVAGEIWRPLWSKLTRNVMTNGIAALTGGTTRTLWSQDRFLPSVIAAARETAAVAAAAGVVLEPVAGVVPGSLLLRADQDPRAHREVAERLRAFALEPTAERDHLPSMLQDVRKGRITEVDAINGYVVEHGSALGVATPVNAVIVRHVHRLEAGEIDIDPSNVDLLREVVESA